MIDVRRAPEVRARGVWPLLESPRLGAIPTYGPIRAIYFVLALCLVLRLNADQGIAPRVTLRAFLYGVPVGLIGARLLDMIEYAGHYHSLGHVLGRDGSSIYGAFFAILIFLPAFVRWHGLSFLGFLDAGAPAMALGEALTRIGCFLNGCCYGKPATVPWAVQFPPVSFAFRDQMARGLVLPTASHSLAVHPVQLYSMVIMLTVTTGLVWWFHRRPAPGQVFFAFLIAYGLLRLGVAPFRTEVLASMTGFSITFIAGGCLGLYWTAHRRGPRSHAGTIRSS